MKRWKQFLTLLLIFRLALGFRSFEHNRIDISVIPLSAGKEGMSSSEEADAEIAEKTLLEEVDSLKDFDISTIVLTEEKEPASEEKQGRKAEASLTSSGDHSFSAGNEKKASQEPVSTVQSSQKQEEPAAAPVNGTEPDKGQDPAEAKTEREAENKTEKTAEHVHEWIEVTVYHEAVTHIEHHDAVTKERWVSVPVNINHYYCDKCRQEFSSQDEAYAHEDASYEAAIEANDMSLIHSGHSVVPETIDQGYYETVTVREAYDETVTDSPAWEEHGLRCAGCGMTK